GVDVVNGQGKSARPEPLHQQLRVGVRAEQQVTWCGELASNYQLRDCGFGGDLCFCHGGFLPIARSLEAGFIAVRLSNLADMQLRCGHCGTRAETGWPEVSSIW